MNNRYTGTRKLDAFLNISLGIFSNSSSSAQRLQFTLSVSGVYWSDGYKEFSLSPQS